APPAPPPREGACVSHNGIAMGRSLTALFLVVGSPRRPTKKRWQPGNYRESGHQPGRAFLDNPRHGSLQRIHLP
ncbi:MAG: hypothetical protein AB7W37_07575, partial [Syntrophobacteraceae bacterium]